jgi:enoyl-CoA hydratase/carnithine racemase
MPSTFAEGPVEVALDGPIALVTLCRPEKLNALDRATLEGLADVARRLDADPAVKVAIVRGAGRAFSAGFDLHDRRWAELGAPEQSAAVGRAMAEAIAGMRAITVASIHGHCIGGGVVLAAACDLRVAASSTRFSIPEVDLGIPLYWAGVPLLVRELGPALTKELVLTGRDLVRESRRRRRGARTGDDRACGRPRTEVGARARDHQAAGLRGRAADSHSCGWRGG